MKKLFLFTFLSFYFSLSLQAQDLRLGFKAGVNFSEITDIQNINNRTGFHLAAVTKIEFPSKLAIQPELIYSSQGADLADLDLSIDYLNLPILLDFSIIKSLSLQVGPQFGFSVSEGKNIRDINSFDFSGTAGIQLSFSKFFAQARYNFGLTDIGFEPYKAKNAVVQISAGFWLL